MADVEWKLQQGELFVDLMIICRDGAREGKKRKKKKKKKKRKKKKNKLNVMMSTCALFSIIE